jgi:hypothetical protein
VRERREGGGEGGEEWIGVESVCVCVCVCGCERETDGQRDRMCNLMRN